MLRSIQVSTDVFAAIWAHRQGDEANEDEILTRILNLKRPTASKRDLETKIGFVDPRFDVVIEPGFQIYRDYLGKRFFAQALQGNWILQDGRGFTSLNDLSKAIGAGIENAWESWFYEDPQTGRKRPVGDKRNPAKIVRRNRRRN